jgi:hypothetical protein
MLFLREGGGREAKKSETMGHQKPEAESGSAGVTVSRMPLGRAQVVGCSGASSHM